MSLDPSREGALFWQLRGRLLRNQFLQLLAQSRLRVSLATILTGLLWIGLFRLFAEGFQFLGGAIPEQATHDDTARAIFNIFFASLTVMLVVSTAILIYSGLYRSSEVQWLLTLPVHAERVFLYKFQEAMLFSSWGFLLLGTPMLIAYGVVERAPWCYFASLLPFLAAFAYIPGSLGAMAALAVVRWLPRRRWRVVAGGVLAVAAVAGGLMWLGSRRLENDLLTPAWFQEVLGRLSITEARLLPSWWLSSGLLEAARGGWTPPAAWSALVESFKFLSLLLANAMLLHQVAVWLAGRTLRPGFDALHGRLAEPKRPRAGLLGAPLLDVIVQRLVFFLPRPMQLLMVKDLRLFRRDPVQWLQFLIFFGLLALYFLNIRRLSYDINYANWVNMISFLNLSVVGLILSTFTTRFIFPMISLEGRRFWILGLLPVRRETILWSKFLFAALGSLAPCSLLVLLSDAMLRVAPLIVAVHLVACLVFCAGLSGIAVGLGARMPNLRDDSPARIAAGFGGTLNLVISTAYIAAVVAMTAVPCHLYLAALEGGPRPGNLSVEALGRLLALGIAASLGLGVLTTLAPLRIGCRAFRALEF